ncbi:MAG: glutamate--cysteine ligase [Rhodothermaceae bacterium]|nr:MAG: glutamate--cysteine ligase [Rhodothermaceae bacterium]
MSTRPCYDLFEAFGVELEYMIVDRVTLAVRPLADVLIHEKTGQYVADVDNGPVAWSNELVNHVVELKTNGPAPLLDGLAALFHANVVEINERLRPHGAMLLPTGAHPLMDPRTETHLWPHEYNEVYSLYNRLFDCRGHGWANLQSTHLNLPFRDEDGFGRLHAAIRVLLPVIPALSASTPLLDGALTGFADSRLETYRHNQDRFPVITGRVIPEAVFTKADYHRRIYRPINEALRPFDTDGVLDHTFVNSRGAIARFDRNAIEIRIIDLQECPAADLAILAGVVAVLRALVAERWVPLAAVKTWHEDALAAIFLDVVRHAERAVITDRAYLRLFGLEASEATAGALWRHLVAAMRDDLPGDAAGVLEHLLTQGSLATRITRRLGDDVTPGRIREVYHELAACLAENRLFEA